MRWETRKDHRAPICDVCHGKLPKVALGRRPVQADYDLGVLVGKGDRLGLLLACGQECADDADSLALDTMQGDEGQDRKSYTDTQDRESYR